MTAAFVAGLVLWQTERALPLIGLLVAIRHPWWAVIATCGWVVYQRLRGPSRPGPDDEARLLDRVVTELDSGASPRAALASVAARRGPFDLSVVARKLAAGLSAREISRSLAEVLPHNGHLVAAAWGLTADAGAPAAPVMALLARRAADRGRLLRERRALTTQARATAWLIAGLPLAVCLGLFATGRIGPGPGLPLVLAGCALQLIGLAVIWAMLRGVE